MIQKIKTHWSYQDVLEQAQLLNSQDLGSLIYDLQLTQLDRLGPIEYDETDLDIPAFLREKERKDLEALQIETLNKKNENLKPWQTNTLTILATTATIALFVWWFLDRSVMGL